ncbi:Gfo/Idh/MocA family oxidoreductase [Rhodobacteraceae bacterium CCMM004]|nr:Gfo/Idh/MocA family oxidoreductase [Rhodobacteraceae bacterium CCMM004]
MKVAIAGVGFRTVKVLGYLRQALPELRYVGYVDPQPTLLPTLDGGAEMARFETVPDMLARTRPDLFFVGSPNHLHLDHIAQGLAADVPHIFAEKPLVVDLEQTWALADLLRTHGPERLIVGLVLRYAPQMVDLTAAMAQGTLGEVLSLEANEHIPPHHGAFFMRDWRRHRRYSGGFLLEKCVHDLDLYNMIAGSRPAKVASFGGRRAFVPENAPQDAADLAALDHHASVWEGTADPYRSDGDIVDFQTALVSYESGATLSFHTNLYVPDDQRRFLVVGTRGMAEGDFQRGFLKITATPSGRRLLDRDYKAAQTAFTDHYGADAQMGRDIAAYLRGEIARLPVSAGEALAAGIAAMALDEARVSGQIVDLAETWDRFDGYRWQT